MSNQLTKQYLIGLKHSLLGALLVRFIYFLKYEGIKNTVRRFLFILKPVIFLLIISFIGLNCRVVLALDCSRDIFKDKDSISHIITTYVPNIKKNKAKGIKYLMLANGISTDEESAGFNPDLQLLYFLCSADSGNEVSAELAVQLSLSGQAPRIPDSSRETLLRYVSDNENNSSYITLSDFYCYPVIGSPCLNSKNAEYYLIKAIKNNSSYAAFRLGYAYEKGTFGRITLNNALACYKLALDRGYFPVSSFIKKLENNNPNLDKNVKCIN